MGTPGALSYLPLEPNLRPGSLIAGVDLGPQRRDLDMSTPHLLPTRRRVEWGASHYKTTTVAKFQDVVS